MSVEVQIYVSNFVKFFTENPNELAAVIGQANPDEFFVEVEKTAYENFDKGEDVELTRKQMIDIVLKLNHMAPEEEEMVSEPIFQTSWGDIFLN